jgi:predicted NBD/HSP70 family sugar kinase
MASITSATFVLGVDLGGTNIAVALVPLLRSANTQCSKDEGTSPSQTTCSSTTLQCCDDEDELYNHSRQDHTRLRS